MRFMMLMKSNPDLEAGVLPGDEEWQAMRAYNQELDKAVTVLTRDGLKPSSSGARLRRDKQKNTHVVDGPFAEAKELVAGYWLIQARSKDEALAWARKVPVKDGEVEVREVFETEDFPVDPAEQEGGWRDKELAARAAPPKRLPGTRRYMAFLKGDALTESEAMPPEEALQRMGALMDEMIRKGHMLSGEGLKPSARGSKVRFAGGKPKVIDGPFAEAKELVAGYIVMQTETREQALDYARRWIEIHHDISGADEATIEVREIWELEDVPARA